MYLKTLELHNFRNYADLVVEFGSGINVLLGENAQGKTNLLESIYFLALTRSHRTNSDRDLISWKTKAARVSGSVQKEHTVTPLEINLSSKGKNAKVNHLEQSRLSQYVGQLNVILFAPEDLSIVKGSPAVRRKFIDMEFGQMSSKYLYNSAQYRSVLKQRNQYIKQLQFNPKGDQVYLDVLSDQLAAHGAEIIFQRIQFLKKLEKWSQEVHKEISQGKEKLSFQYVSPISSDQADTTEKIYAALQALFQKQREKELQQGKTLVGPHLDDVRFMVNDKNVSTFGSQGQQRTTALSVKLAEIDLMKEETGEYPVLLLDDVLSELDDSRQTHLLTAIQNKVQTFITTTSLSGVAQQLINEPHVFNIDHGVLMQSKEE
ncbi:DNA replication/repair protein RecF [Pediococcus pentosaceus]|jgi:DNA replication and repair protein RecF|uniref:DNA replication and repair protein RecF n=3 Tax=Pediococcus pentosaceus TaxID=1255 RepID=RECF_PEDPA|nr:MULTISPECIES: DNA replication/repair protein RecF [Pediococcus]Q03I57.1 RecName: Full=DNA replication and repair protein RecF [Pediococcus pentosaceus ATCC 25745]ABJ67115.1 DNA replication and repair protein RecF [Pediococcus pentosaceus ATCC 25745]ANI97146.1 DNA replication/repair protein RecF [Pediococcus pentosaceus]ASC09319.1 DNA replication and repair protein RecF [Pediococcus pentosaceus]AVL02273.1 DNA replication and repair protein RecF [Pediococcus pentosaceus]AXR42688.1 DNA replic